MQEVEPGEHKYLFPAGTKSGYWHDSGFRKEMYTACRKLGIPRIHPHQLRHFFATRTLEHGAKLEVISKILGHNSVDMTAKIYRHIKLKEYHDEHTKHNPLEHLPGAKRLALPEGQVIDSTAREVANETNNSD
jgi:site-specific recombinase XerD